ncbi:MAG: Zn-ribbon containing protein [Nanoarchaeota archaeon]|nr:Zn-ribbon containing protein [Nanoarchaeota archaeon]
MPYRCVHCSKLYEDASKEVLTGCANCGRKFFFYIKKEKLAMMENSSQKNEPELELDEEERKKIEADVREIAGITNEETPIFLDFESVKVIKEGKYLLDLPKLFSGKPQVYQLEDGRYIVDLSFIKSDDKD